MGDPVVVVREPGRVALHVVVREPLEIGRSCAGVLVDDQHVSRRHVELRPTPDGLVLTDLGSANGTLVEGEAITGPTVLRAGQTARIGDTTIETVEADVPDAPEPAPRTPTTSIARVAASARAERPDLGALVDGGTTTIVFSDIESSTALAVEVGDERWFDVLSVHNEIVRAHVREHGGVEVKSQGDGFMLVFGGARRAVTAMAETLDALATEDLGIRVRVGMHTGEAVADDDGDLIGRAVIIAARVADAAAGGEILVSSLVREILEPWRDIPFSTPRRVPLRGIAGEHLVHPVAWPELVGGHGPSESRPQSPSDETRS